MWIYRERELHLEVPTGLANEVYELWARQYLGTCGMESPFCQLNKSKQKVAC